MRRGAAGPSGRLRTARVVRIVAAALGVLALGGLAYEVASRGAVLQLHPDGVGDGALLGAAQADRVELAVRADPAAELDRGEVRVLHDGRDVTDLAVREGGWVRYRPERLDEGRHEVEVRVRRGVPFGTARHRWALQVDRTPPQLTVRGPDGEVAADAPVAVRGRVAGGDVAELTVAGRTVRPDEHGRFVAALARPPEPPLQVTARDRAGNVATVEMAYDAVAAQRPRRAWPEVRGVHVTAHGWASQRLREPVLDMVRDGRITAVQLDIKDEDGVVGHDSQVPLAREMGAARGLYDLEEAVEQLHGMGVQVVGRIVAFRDPIHADHAWDEGRRDEVLQTDDGGRYDGRYGGFSNYASAAVRDYQIDLAVEAAEAGVDHILWDYIRRPEGPEERYVAPGSGGDHVGAIVEFTAAADRRLRPLGAVHGASVYGIAADRPRQVAQDVPAMAEHLDYVAPMVYPSHWAAGEYGVDDPVRQPYDIVLASLEVFVEQLDGTGATVVPWLQDFSWPITYGAEEVAAQIEATYDAGLREWLLWSPTVRYTEDGIVDPPPGGDEA